MASLAVVVPTGDVSAISLMTGSSPSSIADTHEAQPSCPPRGSLALPQQQHDIFHQHAENHAQQHQQHWNQRTTSLYHNPLAVVGPENPLFQYEVGETIDTQGTLEDGMRRAHDALGNSIGSATNLEVHEPNTRRHWSSQPSLSSSFHVRGKQTVFRVKVIRNNPLPQMGLVDGKEANMMTHCMSRPMVSTLEITNGRQAHASACKRRA
eukprot:9480527-Pyramimonas_sp.AAC.1